MATQLTNYQCPACTGPLHFDGASGKLVCDFCGSSYDTAEIEALYAEKEAAAETAAQNKQAPPPDSVWSENEAAGLRSYSCPSCGAELICDETTAATSCPYCGNPTVIAGQFSGMQRPELVLPFVLDKNAAKAALKKYYRGKRFLPNAFSSQNHIEEIKGVYVPFWLFDANASGSGQYEATTSSSHRNGDYVITTTKHYDVRRAGTTQFMGVPVDGSTKMPNGHSRMQNSVSSELSASITGYNSVSTLSENISIDYTAKHYALLPVWMLHTKWQGKDYLFAMNGQTGKLVGDLPVDKRKVAAWFAGISVPLMILLAILL